MNIHDFDTLLIRVDGLPLESYVSTAVIVGGDGMALAADGRSYHARTGRSPQDPRRVASVLRNNVKFEDFRRAALALSQTEAHTLRAHPGAVLDVVLAMQHVLKQLGGK